MTFAELFPALAAFAFGTFAWFWAKRLRAKLDRDLAEARAQRPAE